MRFRRVALAEARGHILGHNVVFEGRRLLKKGRRLLDAELEVIASTGEASVYVAMLEPGDVDEDSAALRVARALIGAGPLQAKAAHGGRVSLLAPAHGLFSPRRELLVELNLLDGVTLATLPENAAVAPGQLVGTLKVIPFALPEATVAAAERLAAREVVSFRALLPRRVSMLISGAESRRERLFDAFRLPLLERVSRLGAHTVSAAFVALEDEPERELAGAIADELDSGVDLLIVVGETATMDAEDLGPRAIRRAGGVVDVVGAPVFPGNLLLIGHRGGSAILGAPGCVRSRAENVVDRVLPRLLLGDRLGRRDIAELGQGGLLPASRGGEGGAEGGASEHD